MHLRRLPMEKPVHNAGQVQPNIQSTDKVSQQFVFTPGIVLTFRPAV